MPPFTIEFFCPRSGNPNWQPYREGLIFKTIPFYPDLQTAQLICETLIWQYHSARVVDGAGRVVYQI